MQDFINSPGVTPRTSIQEQGIWLEGTGRSAGRERGKERGRRTGIAHPLVAAVALPL